LLLSQMASVYNSTEMRGNWFGTIERKAQYL